MLAPCFSRPRKDVVRSRVSCRVSTITLLDLLPLRRSCGFVDLLSAERPRDYIAAVADGSGGLDKISTCSPPTSVATSLTKTCVKGLDSACIQDDVASHPRHPISQSDVDPHVQSIVHGCAIDYDLIRSDSIARVVC